MNQQKIMHTPVLLQEAIDALQVKKGGLYIDATYGLGGHAKEIVNRGGKVLGIDLDAASIERQQADVLKGVQLVEGNYADIATIAEEMGIQTVDGVLFDLGLSMWQLRESGRGFSYEKDDEVLDMRISPKMNTTAEEIINSYTVDQLYEIIAKYSEEVNSRPIVHAINQRRRIKPIKTVGELKDVLKHSSSSAGTQARVFQALRIEVNDELKSIEDGIHGAYKLVKPGGRIVIISFHTTEDRFIKRLITEAKYPLIAKPIRSKNGKSFERSALLRIIEKKHV